jgi:hypothetical protein
MSAPGIGKRDFRSLELLRRVLGQNHFEGS